MTFRVSGLSNDDVVVGSSPKPQPPSTLAPTVVEQEVQPQPSTLPEFTDSSGADQPAVDVMRDDPDREYPISAVSGASTINCLVSGFIAVALAVFQ
jgi:hypothetical protein